MSILEQIDQAIEWESGLSAPADHAMHMLRLARGEIERLRQGYRDIRKATIEGRVCDDVAWFDTITTLHDFCCCMIGDDGQSDQ